MPQNIYVKMDLLINVVDSELSQMEWDHQQQLDAAINYFCEQLKERTKDVLICDEDDDREQIY